MKSLEDRLKEFEIKLLDNDFALFFKEIRNKLIGVWASEELNIEDKNPFIKKIRKADLKKNEDIELLEILEKEFKEKNYQITKEELKIKIVELEQKAKEELLEENS